jgi:hypothetical protein
MNTNQSIWSTKAATFIIVATAVPFFALLPQTQAVVPPPDGGYPNFNTAEGQNALFSLTTGSANTAIGWFSLWSNTDGSFNTALGAGALLLNIGDQTLGEGIENTAIGTAALLSNTTGSVNTALGSTALLNNTTGVRNTATGAFAVHFNTIGVDNTGIGWAALQGNTTGSGNTAVGSFALARSNGVSNIALGSGSGSDLITGDHNIYMGSSGVDGESLTIRIGTGRSRAFIGGIRGVATGNADAIPVLIDSAGQLGTMSSSRRFKKEMKPIDKASEAILALKPVMFQYEGDKTSTPQFGLIAEEVADVNPDLVVRDGKGEIYTVRYDAVNAMLLNEFLKEHRKVEDQGGMIAELKKEIAGLTAMVREQAVEMQKVRASVDPEKGASRLVANER